MQPVEPNVPKQIVEGYTELGNAMAKELRAAGFNGITTDSTYDAWTPARAYSHYHGGVRILSETASAKLATPVNIKFDELRSREGYDPQKESPNFGPVWKGGSWRLRDITNYMTTAAFSLLKHAAQNRKHWLARFYEIGKEAVRPRQKGELFAYLIPPVHEAAFLVDVLQRGGVEVYSTRRLSLGGKVFPARTAVVRMDQPYGQFAKALLEEQKYPNLRDTSGTPIPPYDVTAHTLTLLMGVKAKPIFTPFRYTASGFLPLYVYPGVKFLLKKPPAIYKSSVPSMDEGWTRWVVEQREFGNLASNQFGSITDEMIRSKNFRGWRPVVSRGFYDYETIIIPDQSPGGILNGHKPGTMPEEYTGGLGVEGVKNLREFVEQGGTLVCLNRASDFAIEQFNLPLRDVTAGLKRTEFYAPGSILRIELDTSHPLAKGMPEESIAWVENSPAFEIKSDPLALARVRIIARYPEKTDPLLSGWLLGGERIKGKAALVEVGLGKGRIYLFGFRPQYRGQSLATYPLLFNAIEQKGSN
jgi:hypothetical protein